MIAFDNGYGAPGPEDLPEAAERTERVRDMLQREADEHMVECAGLKGQLTDIRLPEGHISKPLPRNTLLCQGQRLRRNINGNELYTGTVTCEEQCLGADTASRFENRAAGRVAGAFMQQEPET